VGKPEGKKQLFRSARTWLDNIKMDLENHLGTEVCTEMCRDRQSGGAFQKQ
jgi:hypothetical protein